MSGGWLTAVSHARAARCPMTMSMSMSTRPDPAHQRRRIFSIGTYNGYTFAKGGVKMRGMGMARLCHGTFGDRRALRRPFSDSPTDVAHWPTLASLHESHHRTRRAVCARAGPHPARATHPQHDAGRQ